MVVPQEPPVNGASSSTRTVVILSSIGNAPRPKVTPACQVTKRALTVVWCPPINVISFVLIVVTMKSSSVIDGLNLGFGHDTFHIE